MCIYFFEYFEENGKYPKLMLDNNLSTDKAKLSYISKIPGGNELMVNPMERDKGRDAAELVYQKGKIKPLCEFVENNYFKIFSNRDYILANELTLKTAFLTLLYNDTIFLMDMEKNLKKNTMI
jgi:hypothetical protein